MWAKTLLLLFVFSFLFKIDLSFDQDLGRHIKLGEIIVKTAQVPRTNLFSYTNPDFPFINTHWLFGVLAYLTSQTIGLHGFLVIKLIILLFSIWITLKICQERSGLLLPAGFIFLHVLRGRTELRPEIFSFLFTAVTYYILEKYSQISRTSFKLIFLLPAVQLVWINTHIYFFVGILLQAIFLLHILYLHLRSHIGSGKVKVLGIVFILSVLISFINPHGLKGLLYPLNVNKNYGYTIVENQTMFLLESINFKDANFLFVKMSLAIIALSLLISALRKKIEIKNILIACFGAGLALLNIRSFPYLFFISLPATLFNFGFFKFPKFLSLFIGFLLILESFYYLNGSYYKARDDYNEPGLKLVENGRKALDFVLSNNLPNPIYNNFDIGSYIIYRGFPKYKVFVDGRPEGYPKEFFQAIYVPSQSNYTDFKNLQQKLGFKTIIFSHTDQTPWGKTFLSSVVLDKDWKIVYLDQFIIVLVTNDVAERKNLQEINLSTLNASNFKFSNHRAYLNLSLFLLNTNLPLPASSFAAVSLDIYPQSPIANYILDSLTGQNFNEVNNKFFW